MCFFFHVDWLAARESNEVKDGSLSCVPSQGAVIGRLPFSTLTQTVIKGCRNKLYLTHLFSLGRPTGLETVNGCY